MTESNNQLSNRSHSHLVLLADNSHESARYITRCLRGSGYRVVLARTSDDLLMAEAKEQPSVVLLDEGLAGSVEAVRLVREASEVPIIFMSFIDDRRAAAGLRGGADAVLMKPFSADLLLAEIESVGRRARPIQEQHEVYVLESLCVDFAARSVVLGEVRIHLSAREYRLLHVLTRNAGRVLTHDQLLRLVWGPGYEESGDLLRSYVRNLRRKLHDDSRSPRFVFTESQVGYWMPRAETATLHSAYG